MSKEIKKEVTVKEAKFAKDLADDIETISDKILKTTPKVKTPVKADVVKDIKDSWERTPNELVKPLGGKLFYNTVEQTPVATKLVFNGRRIWPLGGQELIVDGPWGSQAGENNLAREFTLPWEVRDETKGKLFSHFQIVSPNGQIHNYLLDEQSSVILTDPLDQFHEHRKGDNTFMLLINSQSTNDTVVGSSTLVNYQTENCILNRTTLGYGIDKRDIAKTSSQSPKEGPLKTGVAKETRFKNCVIFDSTVTRGDYYETQLRKSRIESNHHVVMENCSLLKCEIIASSNLSIKDSWLTKTFFNMDRDVTVQGIRYNSAVDQARLYGDSLYLFSRFDILVMENPNGSGSIQFFRSGKHEMSLQGFEGSNITFPLMASREEVEKKIKGVIYYDPEQRSGQKPLNGGEFLVDHVVDTIMSRLAVIQKIDQMRNVMAVIEHKPHTYRDMYS